VAKIPITHFLTLIRFGVSVESERGKDWYGKSERADLKRDFLEIEATK
jgi:hypothetical protein